MATSRFVTTAFSIALFASASQAQEPDTSQPPAPTIRVSTHLVLVDVVVTDKQGNAVPGLHPEDFVVEENGKAQKIASFTQASENHSNAAPDLPPGIYTNRPAYRSTGGPVTVLLLDGLNTPFKDQAYARRQMLRFVQEQYKPGQRVAIFALTGSLRVMQDFTTDPQILHDALVRFNPRPQEFASSGTAATSISSTTSGSAVVGALDPSVAPSSGALAAGALGGGATQAANVARSSIEEFAGAAVSYAEEQRAVLTLSALNSLARILGGLPGRKNIIWVTGNMPFSLIPENRTMTDAELGESLPSLDTRRVGEHAAGNTAATMRQSHATDIRETSARLSSAQVSIYPVDARGLSISLDIDSQETMREMARETGGRAYVNQNEIKDGVNRAFEDSAAVYTIGYYPENKKYDGKYRQLKVKLNRPGTEIFHRRGYYAIDPTQLKGYKPETEVAAALVDAAPSTQVSFTAQVKSPSENNSAKGKLGVTFLVDAATVSAEDASNGKHLNVVFYTTIYSRDGRMLASSSQKVDQTFDAATYQQILGHGLMLHMDLDPKPGNNEVRLAVQDAHTGLVGTLDAPAPQ
jgi:VWFA-related protein